MPRSRSPRSPKITTTPTIITNKTVNKQINTSQHQSAVILLILGSLLSAFLVLLIFEYVTFLRTDGLRLGICAIITVSTAFVVAHQAQQWIGFTPSYLVTTFLFVDFTAFLDTLLTLGLLDNITTFGRWYVDMGEEYFKSTSGFFIIGWDGTFHVVLQCFITYCILTKQPYKYATLICMGSVLNSMAPLLVAAASSEAFSDRIKLCTALNPPYVILPAAVVIHCLRIPNTATTTIQKNNNYKNKNNLNLWILTLYHVTFILVGMIRPLVVMKSKNILATWWSNNVEPSLTQDKHLHVTIQCLEWLFWFVPFHMVALFDIWIEQLQQRTDNTLIGSRHRTSLFALILGGYLQSGGLHIWTAIMEWENFTLRVKTISPSMLFWFINLFMIGGAILQFMFSYSQEH
jgi:hypothetical protein